MITYQYLSNNYIPESWNKIIIKAALATIISAAVFYIGLHFLSFN